MGAGGEEGFLEFRGYAQVTVPFMDAPAINPVEMLPHTPTLWPLFACSV